MSGATNLEEFLGTLPQNSGFGHFSNAFGGDLPRVPGMANLRGLGDATTLILVDGDRLTPRGSLMSVDLSGLPLSANKEVRVLPIGGPALFGGEALGGVFDIRLHESFRGFETELRSGATSRGDGEQFGINQLAGWSWAGGNVVGTLGCHRSSGLSAASRPTSISAQNQDDLVPSNRACTVTGLLRQTFGEHWRLGLNTVMTDRDLSYLATPAPGATPMDFGFGVEQKNVSVDLSRKGRFWTFAGSVWWSKSVMQFMLGLQDGSLPPKDTSTEDESFTADFTAHRELEGMGLGDSVLTLGTSYQELSPSLTDPSRSVDLPKTRSRTALS